MGRWENLMCHTDALVYGFSKIHAIFVQYWNTQEFNGILLCVKIFIYIIIVKRYLLCRKYFFSLLKLYVLCEELAIRLKYDGNNRKNIGSDSTWWLLPFDVIEMMMTDKCMRWVCISAGLTTSARCNQCVTKRRSQSAENFPIAILMERGAHLISTKV